MITNMTLQQKFNEYIASGDPFIIISTEERDFILPFIEREVAIAEMRVREVSYIHYNLRHAIQNERDGLNIKGHENDVEKWLNELQSLTQEDKIK